MNKKLYQNRWTSEEFVSAQRPCLAEVFEGLANRAPYDLRGLSVGVEGPVKDLWTANFKGTHLTELDFSYSNFECSFNACVFVRVKLDWCSFADCLMFKARFKHCMFIGTKLIVSMDDSVFEECDFSQARFGRRGVNEYGGRRTRFFSCDFTGCVFKGVEFRASKFIDCKFDRTVFEKCDFRGAKFENVAPSVEAFKECDLRGATLNGNLLS